jgi:hypothetical protein
MIYDQFMIGHKPVKMSGVKEAVKELRKIDPELRKQFNKDAKAVVRPVIDAAKSNYPSEFLSGMSRPGHKTVQSNSRMCKPKPNQV